MSLTQAQQMGMQQSGQSPYGGVALGHLPQQTNRGLGPNRYVPPTFDWGRGGLDGNQRQRNQMNWNQMQDYYLPNQGGQRSGSNQYGGALRQMLEQFGGQYGGAGRRPQLPQFSSYDPGFGGPTSYYDQQQSRGMGGRGGQGWDIPAYDGTVGIDLQEWRSGGRRGARGGGDSVGDVGFGNIYDSGQRYDPNDRSLSGPRRGYMEGGSRGGGFNPYQLMQQNLGGMSMNQMFDPRWASIFGGQGFGQMQPNPRPMPTMPDLAAGNKPYQMPGG